MASKAAQKMPPRLAIVCLLLFSALSMYIMAVTTQWMLHAPLQCALTASRRKLEHHNILRCKPIAILSCDHFHCFYPSSPPPPRRKAGNRTSSRHTTVPRKFRRNNYSLFPDVLAPPLTRTALIFRRNVSRSQKPTTRSPELAWAVARRLAGGTRSVAVSSEPDESRVVVAVTDCVVGSFGLAATSPHILVPTMVLMKCYPRRQRREGLVGEGCRQS